MSRDSQSSPADADRVASGDEARPDHLSKCLAVFVLGLVIGLGSAGGPNREFLAGLLVLAVLALILALINRAHVNQRKRLTAGEAGYRAFFEHAVEGIFRTTPDGHYLAINPALAGIYGYASPAEMMSRLTDIGAQLYVKSGRREEFRSLMQAHDLVTDFVSEIHHQSGKRIWISENARAVRDWSGALICYEGTVEDVTHKIEAERTLRAALRQAELANRTKAAFLAAMSHELKTPLNAVLGFSEIIRDELLGPVGQGTYRDYAADIHASGKRLLAVINDVLDVSRLEGGQLTIDVRPVSVREIAEQAIAMARSATGENRAVAIEIPAGLPSLQVDPRRISQAVANLLSNAVKFTPAGGHVAVAARLRADDGIDFIVTDTGIGMLPETIAAAMEPFRQLDGSLARKFEGAGLGLSIARALTELHGGTLTVESEVGSGTKVSVILPPFRSERLALSA